MRVCIIKLVSGANFVHFVAFSLQFTYPLHVEAPFGANLEKGVGSIVPYLLELVN